MSVVAVRLWKDVVEIAADSQVTTVSGAREVDQVVKLFEAQEDFFVGTAGSAQEAGIARLYAAETKPSRPEEIDISRWLYGLSSNVLDMTGERMENDYIFVLHGFAFVASGFYLRPVSSFAAIGSGATYANVSMELGQTAKNAVEMAINFDIFCCGPVNTFLIERDNDH